MSLRRKPRLVVVGNGMAGMRTVEELLKLDADGHDITVFGSEAHGNYNRILLSPVLAGDKQFADIMLNTREWYESQRIRLHAGDPVVRIDRQRRVVIAHSGLEAPYDRLLLATGSKPFVIPVPGHQLPGVIAFRDIADVEAMLSASRTHRRAAVIGGGLLGLEAANGLMRQGMDVTVIHVMDSLMERQLDKPAAALLQAALERRGLQFRLSAQTAEIVGSDRVTAIRFKDGSELTTDLVVMAVGIRPNIELAKTAGLLCDRAIVVDDTLQTHTDPRIYAVGECVQHRGAVYGLVAPLWEQARVCAAHLAALGVKRYGGSVTSTKLKVTGIDLYSAGDFIGGADTEDLVLRDPRRGVYKRLVIRKSDGVDRIVGAVLYGDVADGPWYFELMQKCTDVATLRNKLLFGRAFCDGAGQAA
ncbi:assimilatory nitrate reductase (NADH) beta subunit [Hydrocarboniphaga daqingensis]|uniref:Assimilatory nitrate reductase (NADH) beta subunit n=1 Tax=Hydrocarboniphaga daqingensis TaxID=490188 RepID=A0A1M5JMI1_9GAMM|nr:FAD-dependent oxidoreductase [Hydrocarboniphaga daqingensis]SHG41731.1 assimilatory nitrate reductase (NADH) beta subunit [Hydrocarboniphaga daqingensis]